MKNQSQLLALVVVAALGIGCQTSRSVKQPSPRGTARAAQTAQSAGKVHVVPSENVLYFDNNAFQLDEPSMALLTDYAEVLAKNPRATISITGHADERGPTEYNLSLGEARARAARKYLLGLGVKRHQINISTFGEERPAVEGSSEHALAKNRRDEIVVAFR